MKAGDEKLANREIVNFKFQINVYLDGAGYLWEHQPIINSKKFSHS